jgi:Protein of unknown function (DUF2384)
VAVAVRVKLVMVADEKILLLRVVGAGVFARKELHQTIQRSVGPAALTFDGEIYRIRGQRAIQELVPVIRDRCQATYDPNLLGEGLEALRNPWPIPEEPRRNPADRPVVYMARVWHHHMAESIAFQLPRYHDDFIIEFRRQLGSSEWREYRKDLNVWIVADHYEPTVHDILDRFFECRWDEFLAGDEWNVLPPPAGSQYRTRTLEAQDFRVLGVEPGCALWEIHAAYREQKEKYVQNDMHPDEWYDVDTAFQRINKHYKPPQDEEDLLPDQVAAPTPIVLLLRQVFTNERDRVLWYHRFQHSLRKAPVDLATTDEGTAQVVRLLELMLLIKQKAD